MKIKLKERWNRNFPRRERQKGISHSPINYLEEHLIRHLFSSEDSWIPLVANVVCNDLVYDL